MTISVNRCSASPGKCKEIRQFRHSPRLVGGGCVGSTSSQLLQQSLGLGFVGEGEAGTKQGFEHRLSVGGATDAVERHSEVISDGRVLRGREIGRTEICYGLVGCALGQQNPSKGVIDRGGAW